MSMHWLNQHFNPLHFPSFFQGVCDHIYKNPVKISEHTNYSGSYSGALGFMLQVELLSLKMVSTASLLAWLTRPTGPLPDRGDLG